jgi:hypothetical protein
MAGPARRYRRRSPGDDRAASPSAANVEAATRLGCRDAVKGRKNPHKPEARGFVSAYREGYRICEAIYTGRERFLKSDEKRVMHKLKLETEVQHVPLSGTRRRRRR